MIKVKNLPKNHFTVAVSGGPDSMSILHFLMQSHKDRLDVVHINHQTPFAPKGEALVKSFCEKHSIPLRIYTLPSSEIPKGVSKEEYWRNQRYQIFHAIPNQVITGHHLNDCVETWIFSSLHGDGKIIPFQNKNVIRPFLLSKRQAFMEYAARKDVPFVLDPSNDDTSFMRNHIRHVLMPQALIVNEGLEKTISRKVEKMYNDLPLITHPKSKM